MDLHLFFEGSIGRETVSSALLATVLEQFPDERNAFFELLGVSETGDLVRNLPSFSWDVGVEQEQVDVRLSSRETTPRHVVLIENKICASAKQVGQLLRYYEKQKKAMPEAKIVAVYLAPGGIGKGEVEVVKAESLRAGDIAVHVSWGAVLKKLAEVSQSDFVKSGLEQIESAIERGQQEVYPLIAGREEIADLVNKVRERILTLPIKLGTPWPAADRFTVGTYGTNMTAWLRFKFEAEPETNRPLNLYDGKNMVLTFQSMLKVSAAGARDPQIKASWKALEQKKELNVEGVGLHKLEGRWFTFERKCIAPPSELVEKFTALGSSVLRFVESWGMVGSGQNTFNAGSGEA